MRYKKILKDIAYWSVSPGLEVLLKAKLRKLKGFKYNFGGYPVDFTSNKDFRNIHKGERCFILATGPSVNDLDLRPLGREICISISGFYHHKDISHINPAYHVDAPNHAPFDFNPVKNSFDNYRKCLPNKTHVFLGHATYKYSILDFLKTFPEYATDRFHHIDYTGGYFLDEALYPFSENNWDISGNPFLCRSSLYIAIQLAVYMGCEKIYLLGCDHNYIRDLESVTAPHFYAEPTEDHQNAKKFFDEIFDTEKWFYEYYRRWKDYKLIRAYIEMNGGQICNATQGSMIDVFPKVSLKDILC